MLRYSGKVANTRFYICWFSQTGAHLKDRCAILLLQVKGISDMVEKLYFYNGTNGHSRRNVALYEHLHVLR